MFPPLGFWAAGTAVTFSTWNPSNITGSVTLSGGNLVATTGGAGLVRSTTGWKRGKFYFEVTVTGIWASPSTGIGVGHGSTNSTSIGNTGFGGAFIYRDGSIWNGEEAVPSAGALPSGARIGGAVDLDLMLVWFRVNGGNWNFNASNNPTTGVGGVRIDEMVGTNPVFQTFSAVAAEAGATTANFGASAFGNAAPAGFGANGSNAPFVTSQRVLYGVNLAGAEFGSTYPGTYNTDYTYPPTSEIDYYASKGMGIIRLPFRWERLQRTLNGALDSTEAGRIDTIVNYAATKNMKVMLDPHNYAAYSSGGVSTLVGTSGGIANSTFADFWSRVATRYLSAPHVIFALMNEPNAQTASQWLASANAAIAAIRATGATHRIYVPGTAYTGGWSWHDSGNAAVMTGVVDSGNNYAYEIHQYFDTDSSSTTDMVVSTTIGSERLSKVTAWARSHGKKLQLGEFGVGQGTDALLALEDMLDFLDANADVWEAATWWAGGPWWSNPPNSFDYYNLEPLAGVDKPQMDVIEGHIA